MNALSKIFEVLHLSRGEMTLRRSHRRRRARRRESALSCETLEPKQLLAAHVGVEFSDLVLDTTDSTTVAIEGKFQDDAVSGTVVKFETNAPTPDNDFYVELTSNTPFTNENFLSYVNSGAYDNSMFHRSVSDFVVQGGGFKAPTLPANLFGSDPVAIPTTGTVQNEPYNTNTRGTIAMAKVGGDPNSATSQFFFNLSDNNLDQFGNPGGFLDIDNGGYTVFGAVLGSGMTVVDLMAIAKTYDATAYYANTAFREFPLYNLNLDNIVLPNDFVKIENVDQVTESALFTYQVSSSDTAKLTASYDGNGNLVLTPDSGATGSVDVTVTATSVLDNTIASDTFSVQLNGGGGGTVDPVLTPVEEIGNTFLNTSETGAVFAGNQAIVFRGSQITSTQFANYQLKAVEDFGENGGKQLLWEHADGFYYTWNLTETWGFSTATRTNANAATNLLVNFGLATASPDTPIEEFGTTSLIVGSGDAVFAGEQPIRFRGSQITSTQFENYQLKAVEDFGENGGKQLLWEHADGYYYTWNLTETWEFSSATTTSAANAAATTTLLENFELVTSVEKYGTTLLTVDNSGGVLANNQPVLFRGSQITSTQFANYQLKAVEDFGENGGKQLLWEHADGYYYKWDLTETWEFSNGTSVSMTNNGVAQSFGLIQGGETNGNTSLIINPDGTVFADSAPILYQGTQITSMQFRNYEPLATEDFGENGGKQILFRHSTGYHYVWTLSETWEYQTGSLIPAEDSEATTELLSDFGL